MIDPSKIIIATQCSPVEPFKSEVIRLFKSINSFGGNLANAKKVVCLSASPDSNFENELKILKVNIKLIDPLDEHYHHSNKIQMLQIEDDYDVLIALDTDIIVTRDFTDYIDKNKISAKIVDTDCLGLENWEKLFNFFKLDVPVKRFQTCITNVKTIPWFNSGVLFIPKKYSLILYKLWIQYTKKLLENYYSLSFLSGDSFNDDSNFIFIDQYALALSIHDLKLFYNPLPLEFNFPTHYSIHPDFLPQNVEPFLIHYHHRLTKFQNVMHCFYSKVNQSIDSVNSKINFNYLNKIDYELLVDDCYIKILDRFADKEGLKYYAHLLDTQIITVNSLEKILTDSDEFKNK